MRPYLLQVRLVYIRQEKLGRESVANGKKLQYPSLLLASIQTLRIEKLDPDFYFSDEEIEYISLDTLIDKTKVLTACINQAKPVKKAAKKLVKQILH